MHANKFVFGCLRLPGDLFHVAGPQIISRCATRRRTQKCRCRNTVRVRGGDRSTETERNRSIKRRRSHSDRVKTIANVKPINSRRLSTGNDRIPGMRALCVLLLVRVKIGRPRASERARAGRLRTVFGRAVAVRAPTTIKLRNGEKQRRGIVINRAYYSRIFVEIFCRIFKFRQLSPHCSGKLVPAYCSFRRVYGKPPPPPPPEIRAPENQYTSRPSSATHGPRPGGTRSGGRVRSYNNIYYNGRL